MYCILQYISYVEYKRCLNESISTLRSLYYSDVDPTNLELYFNPNCVLQLILDYICNEVNLNLEGESYDLANEAGDLLGVKDYKPTINGTALFRPRETYFMVLITRSATENHIEAISPLLNPCSRSCLNLVKILSKNVSKKKSSLIKRHSSSKNSITHSQGSNTSTKSKTKKRRSSANL